MILRTKFSGYPATVDRLKLRSLQALEARIVKELVDAKRTAIVRRTSHAITVHNYENGRIFATYELLKKALNNA